MRRAAISVLLGLALLGQGITGCRGRQGPPVSVWELRRKHHVHEVQPGESAWKIARRYQVNLDALVELNELRDPSRLHPGDELLIPGLKVEAAKRAPASPPATNPVKPEIEPAEARPKKRTCEQVEQWIAPPKSVTKSGYSWPVDGVVITKYGKQDGLPYEGIDIAAPVGTPVRAAAAGKIRFVGKQGGFGNLVLVEDREGRITVYAHQHVNCVAAEQQVARGELLGLVGQTGGARSPYLYFEVREGKKTVNPRAILPR